MDTPQPTVLSTVEPSGSPRTAREWVESPVLPRLAAWVAHRYSLRPQDAEDLLQEVQLALLLRLPDLPVNVSFVYHTAAHKAVDIMRLRAREVAVGCQEAPSALDGELVHLLRTRISSLPDRLQRFCRLRYEQGFTCQEVSDLLGLSRASVRWMETQSLRILAGGPDGEATVPGLR